MQYLEFEQPIADLEKIQELEQFLRVVKEVLSKEVESLKIKVKAFKITILTRWQRVQLARHPERTSDYMIVFVIVLLNYMVIDL